MVDEFNFFFADQHIRLYDTTHGKFKEFRDITARDVGWSIIDTDYRYKRIMFSHNWASVFSSSCDRNPYYLCDHSVATEQSFSMVLFVPNTYLHEMMINYSLTLGCFLAFTSFSSDSTCTVLGEQLYH